MNRNTIFKKVKEILIEELGINGEDMIMTANLTEDLEMDSFDIASLVATLEEKFEIDIHDEDVTKFIIVKDIIDYLEISINY
jgi:acyl carrier protein